MPCITAYCIMQVASFIVSVEYKFPDKIAGRDVRFSSALSTAFRPLSTQITPQLPKSSKTQKTAKRLNKRVVVVACSLLWVVITSVVLVVVHWRGCR